MTPDSFFALDAREAGDLRSMLHDFSHPGRRAWSRAEAK